MKNMKPKQSVAFTWSALVLVTIASVMTVAHTSAAAPRESGSSTVVSAAEATPADSIAQVKIDNFVYSPVPLTVKVGTQVTWINHDDIAHTVDSTQGKFKSPALDTDDKFQFRFTEPGEYPFYCRLHPKMTGKIIVQP